jgi:hypothetical protein
MLISNTSFLEATNSFKHFLAENNLPTDILWLFKEDTISKISDKHETDFWLKIPLDSDNEMLMEQYYEFGKRINLGVSFGAFALCDGKICCSVIIPKDEEDSEFLMFSPAAVKFTFVKDLPIAKVIKNRLKWLFYKLQFFEFEQGCFMIYLPSKIFATNIKKLTNS